MSSALKIVGARENNLKGFSLTIPHDRLVVITGLSGSGKSTLAFDTIYAEGGRRYIETFSPYTRQFLDRLHQPELDAIEGVRPALALEQRNRTTSSRSTVGTITEINDYLKLVWSHLSTINCPTCGTEVRNHRPHAVMRELRESATCYNSLVLLFQISITGAATAASLAEALQSEGFLRYYDRKTNSIERLEKLPQLSATNSLDVVVDRISIPIRETERLISGIQNAYHFGHGRLSVLLLADNGLPEKELVYSEQLRCSGCNRNFPIPRPSLFTFNSPIGACKECSGFGKILSVDPARIIQDPALSIDQKVVSCWATPATRKELSKLKAFCARENIDTSTPWYQLPRQEQQLIFEGRPKDKAYRGINGWFEHLKTKRHKMHVRIFIARYRTEVDCPSCHGGRLDADAFLFLVRGQTLRDIWRKPIDQLLAFFREIRADKEIDDFSKLILDEVLSRLEYLTEIGLGYLTLDRQTKTLSGGEFQRVNLTTILGANLTQTSLVLDEPTIGLHPRDTQKLIAAMTELRERGNSVIVVEHEPEVMRAADQIIDLGPESGEAGGEIVFQGTISGLKQHKSSLTGRYLAGKLPTKRKYPINKKPDSWISIYGAAVNNLKQVDLKLPLQRLVVITGVSGSGKSSLVHRAFYENLERKKRSGAATTYSGISGLSGDDEIDSVVMIDQSPIGKSPRSNPATYTKVWEIIRECLASTELAQKLGLGRAAFSFNVDGGRCPNCKGAGFERVEMQFLADVFVECEHCGGSRFKDAVLTVEYKGKSVQDFLKMTLDETYSFFENDDERGEKVRELLHPLVSLGLGYLKLGQPLSEVSGGEAQRIKLASYLHEKGKTLFILDEPTTGLHPINIQALLDTFDILLSHGHSIICVEHNLDVIRCSDWLIDLGPEGGERGGEIVLSGETSKLLNDSNLSTRSHTIAALNGLSPQYVPASSDTSPRSRDIKIVGARHHNLKNISVTIPHDDLTVITGVSGSGKSSLAFDILFQEGQRRYIDCLSPYARQYITQISRAEVDRIENITPTIAISQKTAPPHGVSTLATTTEIYQYLRLLFSKVGRQHCPDHDLPISGLTSEEICQELLGNFKGKRLHIFAPVVSGRKGYYNDLINRAISAEISEARIDGKIRKLEPDLRLERHKLHWISLLTGNLIAKDPQLLKEAVDQALLLGSGTIEVSVDTKDSEPLILSSERVCPKCKKGFRQLDPQDFSFRSARGVCRRCDGRGVIGDDLTSKSSKSCPECNGARIGAIGRHVYINSRSIDQLTRLNARELLQFFEVLTFPERLNPVVSPIIKELKSRLEVMLAVGLDYLSLDRDSHTLSGGEAQRLRLARTLGSPLTGVCYVLDEPTIGLHAKDNELVMNLLRSLSAAGNTVVVVEHDEETILQADHIIDIGPTGGSTGGRVVFEGAPRELLQCQSSLTGAALAERLSLAKRRVAESAVKTKSKKATPKEKALTIQGASTNNLKNVTAEFPLNRLITVCGVSGAGKSSLVHGTLIPAVLADFENGAASKDREKSWHKLANIDSLERLVEIDQSPIGRTPTSTPASYLGIFDDIRKIYAATPEAKSRGWSSSHFSFNSGKGRCEGCEGRGFVKIPMSFLPDAISQCEICQGLRYNEATLEILYQGLSLGEVLQKTMSEALAIFANHSKVHRALEYVEALGLGYLTLGQPTYTLSGGEAQRLKIAEELGKKESINTLYVLDEPTIGLHMTDVGKLISVMKRLVERGNTVVVIEHNLDVIRQADYLIELGPGAGEKGGNILFAGSPVDLIQSTRTTPTREALLAWDFSLLSRITDSSGLGHGHPQHI